MSDDMYGWTRCTHEGIGLPGCPTCDPDKHRCLARAQRQHDALRAQLAQAGKAMQSLRADAADALAKCAAAEAQCLALRDLLRRIHTLVFKTEPKTGDYAEYIQYSAERSKTWGNIVAALAQQPSNEALREFGLRVGVAVAHKVWLKPDDVDAVPIVGHIVDAVLRDADRVK